MINQYYFTIKLNTNVNIYSWSSIWCCLDGAFIHLHIITGCKQMIKVTGCFHYFLANT